jgi:hypothetical protein
MRQEPDSQAGILGDQEALDEADRASRELGGQIERARLRLLREYRAILRDGSVREDAD